MLRRMGMLIGMGRRWRWMIERMTLKKMSKMMDEEDWEMEDESVTL